jgi:hypothetical protein
LSRIVFFDVGDSSLWLTYEQQRVAKLEMGTRIIAVERCCPLELDLRFDQSVLNSTDHPHRKVRHRAVLTALKSFEEQQLCSGLILFRNAAPSVSYIGNQNRSNADPCID